jgi:uncharacterized protein
LFEGQMTHDISQVDFEALGSYLRSDLSPANCMLLPNLDGFLTGIAIGPELIPPGEWLPVIWGGDEPEFESVNQKQMIVGTITGRYDEIVTVMNRDSAAFEPIFCEAPDDTVTVTDWAAGFLDAITLRRMSWKPLFNHRRAKTLVEPLIVLGDSGAFADERAASKREREFYASRPNVIPTCVDGIYNFWKDWQDRQKAQPRRIRRSRR